MTFMLVFLADSRKCDWHPTARAVASRERVRCAYRCRPLGVHRPRGVEVDGVRRWPTGRLALETFHLPRPIAQICKIQPETVAALDQWLDTHTDEAAASPLAYCAGRDREP